MQTFQQPSYYAIELAKQQREKGKTKTKKKKKKRRKKGVEASSEQRRLQLAIPMRWRFLVAFNCTCVSSERNSSISAAICCKTGPDAENKKMQSVIRVRILNDLWSNLHASAAIPDDRLCKATFKHNKQVYGDAIVRTPIDGVLI